jgi:hypothetical protein
MERDGHHETRVPRIPWHDHEHGEALRQIAGIRVEPKPQAAKVAMGRSNDWSPKHASGGQAEPSVAREVARRGQRQIGRSACSEEDCRRPAAVNGYCALHD